MLIAVDHSENAQRAVDYVARMIGNHPEIIVTVLHAIRSPEADAEPDAEERESGTLLLAEQKKRLMASGLPPERVKEKLIVYSAPHTAADVILEEKHNGSYETVVVGRRGVSRKEEFLFGSVSARVVREAGPQAVWVVT